jgi:hypothetical protein
MAYLPAIRGAAVSLGMSFVPDTVNAAAGTVGRFAVGAERKLLFEPSCFRFYP